MGSILGTVYAYDSSSGAQLATLPAGGALASPAVVVDGELYVGAGTASRESSPETIEYKASLVPSAITAFCLVGTDGCNERGKCNTGKPCLVGQLGAGGTCQSFPALDGTACQIGTLAGTCVAGACNLSNLDCDDGNQCTHDAAEPTGCTYTSEPSTTPCVVNGQAGVCVDAYCSLATGSPG